LHFINVEIRIPRVAEEIEEIICKQFLTSIFVDKKCPYIENDG